MNVKFGLQLEFGENCTLLLIVYIYYQKNDFKCEYKQSVGAREISISAASTLIPQH